MVSKSVIKKAEKIKDKVVFIGSFRGVEYYEVGDYTVRKGWETSPSIEKDNEMVVQERFSCTCMDSSIHADNIPRCSHVLAVRMYKKKESVFK